MEAANFYVAFEVDKDALWEEPLLGEFLARHGGTLLQLSGVPLALVARVSQEEQPALDLSGLRLTKLGIDCCDVKRLMRFSGSMWTDSNNISIWLWPERLPGTLEELHLLALGACWLGYLEWAPQSTTGLALPRLHTLCVEATGPVNLVHVPLLEGFPVLPAFKVDASGADVAAHADLFGRVRSVRIADSGRMRLWGDREDVATFVNCLCPAGLQAAELCAEDYIDLGDPLVHEIVHGMVSGYGDRFAVEVGVPEQPHIEESCDKTTLHRLTWRRWPAPGAPGLPAARAAHERARAWAAEAEQWEAEQQRVEEEHAM